MFYARRTVTKTSPDSLDTAIKVVQEQVIPAAQGIPGFMGGYWFADRATGDGVGFTFFDTKEALETSRPAADQIRTDAARAAGAEVVSVDHFEVLANTGEKVHEIMVSEEECYRTIEQGDDEALKFIMFPA